MSEETHFTADEAAAIGEQLGIDWTKFDVEQFRQGMDVELEHGLVDPETNVSSDDPLITGKIALAHLREYPDYYDRLEAMEVEAEAYWEGGAETEREPAPTPSEEQLEETPKEEAAKEEVEAIASSITRENKVMSDYLQREDAPFGEEVWELLDATVTGAATSQLSVRRVVQTVGPYGYGLKQLPGTDELVGEQDGVSVAASRAIPVVQLSAGFALSRRDIAAFKATGISPSLAPAARAALAIAAQEDKILLEGSKKNAVAGLINTEGISKVTLRDWNEVGAAAANMIEAVSVLDKAGFHGPYSLALAPEKYNLLFRRYPQGNATELEHIGQFITGAVVKAPALSEGALLLASGPQYVAILVGQDLTVGFVGPTADLGYEFTVSESFALQVRAPGAICVLK
jgi:uncharacterized linocin/CFP29 family protein